MSAGGDEVSAIEGPPLPEWFRYDVLLHDRCGQKLSEHPMPHAPAVNCPFPALPPREFRVAVEEELPPVVRRVAEQIDRGARNFSPSEAVAGVICSTGEVAAGLAALPVLEQLRARHVKRVWGAGLMRDGSERPGATVVCAACNTSWPCRDAEILGVE